MSNEEPSKIIENSNEKSDINNKNDKSNIDKNLKIEDHPDRSIIIGNLAKNINTLKIMSQNMISNSNKISRFHKDKKENKALSEKEHNQIENMQILDRFLNDIFTTTTPKMVTSVNRYSEDVTNDETREEVLKLINNPKTTKDEKNNLYFKLKARIIFIFIYLIIFVSITFNIYLYR
jgi:hypothetical protein